MPPASEKCPWSLRQGGFGDCPVLVSGLCGRAASLPLELVALMGEKMLFCITLP